ncbi:MAG: GTPase HflX [Candidatus Aminicenantes bacterium]|nr:GTPase HflX [Candidatus Aminicenantes bacterium]
MKPEEEPEKSILVALFEPGARDSEIKCILDEMELLTRSAGGQVVASFPQKRRPPDARYLVGKGKVEEIKNFACAQGVNLIIFYNRLSNVQQRNLEKFFDMKVIDRTRLILDVFATRARSLEGKLQVELAQLLYLLPRLTGKGVELSRLGGGIGSRGPGETKLEADRRTINKRIALIKQKLDKVIRNRDIQRQSRKTNPIPVVSLVGYTSAGKSTLFRALTGEEVAVSPLLFSTLDPVLRRVELGEIEEGYCLLLSDTVGFIRQMPKELFQAFQATLEEIVQADLILHIIDVSDPDYLSRKEEVQVVLDHLKIPAEKIIHVYNKIDLLMQEKDNTAAAATFDITETGKIFISATQKQGLRELKKAIFVKYFSDYGRYRVQVPIGLINPDSIPHWAIVLAKSFQGGMLNIEILCSQENMVKFKEKYGGYVACVK